MAHEWLEEVVRGAGDATEHITRDFRPANRLGCLFVLFAVFGLVTLALTAFAPGIHLRPAGWWVGGGVLAGSAIASFICFWIGSSRANPA